MADLRPYQSAALEAVLAAWESGARAPLVVWPTGAGKTVLFAKIAEAVRPTFGRTLVLAHREELIFQARDKIAAWTALSTAIEMAESRADGALLGADVVVASVQSLIRRRTRYTPEAFGLVVVDEAHHAPAVTYRTLLDYFAPARRLGVTATPDRLDGQGLKGLFDVAAHVYDMRDAIRDGWLVPIRQKAVVVHDIDLSGVRTVAGDFHEGDLERAVLHDRALHGVAEPLARLIPGRRTLVFGTTVAHAEALADVLRGYCGADAVRCLDGTASRDTRRATLDAFRAGAFPVLCNVMLFTEGFDEPRVDAIAMVRPTKSRALYQQVLGRGTRLWCPHGCDRYCAHPDRKADLLAIDFEGNAGRHRLITAVDVLAGSDDERLRARITKLLVKDPQLDLLTATERAGRELADEDRADEHRRAGRPAWTGRAQVTATVADVDPFAVFGVYAERGRYGGAPMTDAQAAVLARAGIPTASLDRGQASALIDALIRRREVGGCTYKQAARLARYGVKADGLTLEGASRLITIIAAHGWTPSPRLRAALDAAVARLPARADSGSPAA